MPGRGSSDQSQPRYCDAVDCYRGVCDIGWGDVGTFRQRRCSLHLATFQRLTAPRQPLCRVMLTTLPNELVIEVLAYVPLSTLVALHSVSRTWNRLLDDPRTAERVYHGAAVLHEYSMPGEALSEARGAALWLKDATTWREFCGHEFCTIPLY